MARTASAIFFSLGIVTVLIRKNAIGIFMGIELMLNAAALNFVAFQSFRGKEGAGNLDGYLMTTFIIVMAAIEAAIAFAIVVRMFAVRGDINPQAATELRG